MANYISNPYFGVREIQSTEPWCTAYVQAAALNTLYQATDTPSFTAESLMRAYQPMLTDEELKKSSPGAVENVVKVLKEQYNIGVIVENRALSFEEVKSEIDAGQIIQMDAENINATTEEERYGHAFAIVGYVLSADGSGTPYYKLWNPWWQKTFYVPTNSPTFRVGGVDYNWFRTWHNWTNNGASATMDDAVLDTEVTMQVSGSLLASLTDTGVDSAIYTSYFGKETTVNSWLQWGEVYGYALSTDYERSVQRSRHDDRITTNPGNSEVAQTYKGYVDEVISLQNQIIWLGVGTAIAVALAALAVAFVSGYMLGVYLRGFWKNIPFDDEPIFDDEDLEDE